MSAALDNRASVIRGDIARMELPLDPATVRRYSIIAARWEELRLLIHEGKSAPADEHRFREGTPIFRALTAELGLDAADETHPGPETIPGITGWDGFLACDFSYLIANETWQSTAADWRDYAP